MNLKKFSKFKLSLFGKKVYYLQSCGQGPTVLFLHGLGIDSKIWNMVFKEFGDRFNIVLLDLPGYGSNIDLQINPEFDDISKFIFNFIEKKGSISYLVGYSLSGVFSYQIAQDPPASLKKIVCISAPIFNAPSIILLNVLFKFIGFHHLFTRIVMFFIVRFPLKQLIFLIGGLASITKPKAMNDCMNKFGTDTNPSYIFNSASTIFSPTQFKPITVPLEFIYGEKDRFATPHMAKIAQSYCKSSNLYLIEDSYHLIPFEKPIELAHIIKKVII